jgi:hypothetical protein
VQKKNQKKILFKKFEIMKKLLFIFTLFISVSSVAQTKEETIEWINTNGKDLTYFSVEDKPNLVSYEHKIEGIDKDNQNLIIYYGIHHYTKNLQTNNLEYKNSNDKFFHIPLKSVLYEEISTLQKKVADRANRQYYIIKLAPQTPVSMKENDNLTTINANSFEIFYNNEENISRVIKAIMHLAKLNGAKENKQTF